MLKEFEWTIVVHRSDSIQSPAQKGRVTTTRKCLDLYYNVKKLLLSCILRWILEKML